MVNPIFDTGVFLVMLVLAPILFFASIKNGTVLLIPATGMFVILGMILLTGYDVVSYTYTTDGTTNLNTTNWFVKNTMQNGNVQWLGWVFLVIGLISGAKFLNDATDNDKPFI